MRNGLQWESNYCELWEYDDNNNMIQHIWQKSNGLNLVNDHKHTKTYNLDYNLTEGNYTKWNGTTWINNALSIYSYKQITDIKDEELKINDFSLSNNYPNPFNPTTIIKYTIPERSNVLLKVFDTLGKDVSTLLSDEQPKGNYEIEFNASELTSGIYFYSLQVYPANGGTGEFVETKKMILIK